VDVGITVEEAPVTLQLDGVDRELAVGAHTLRRKDGATWQVDEG
jgi:hypothetical protein